MTIQSSLLGILADGSQAKPQPLLVVPEWHDHAHGWSRDSDELLVVAFGETTDMVQPPSYDVAADGRFLMIKADDGARDSTTEIVIVQNWDEYVRQLVPSD